MERVMDLDKKRLVRTALLKAFDAPQMPPSDDLIRLAHRLDDALNEAALLGSATPALGPAPTEA